MPQFTLAELSARVLDRLDNNSLLYPDTEITAAINEALRLTNLAVGFNQSTVVYPNYSQPCRHWYSLAGLGILVPMKIQFEGSYLEPVGMVAMGEANPRWLKDTTDNTGMPVTNWIRWGLDRFGIWPADSEGGGQLLVTGITAITPLVNQTDVIKLGRDIVNCLDLYCSHVLQMKEADGIFKASSADYAEYQRNVKRLTWIQDMEMPRWPDQSIQATNRA